MTQFFPKFRDDHQTECLPADNTFTRLSLRKGNYFPGFATPFSFNLNFLNPIVAIAAPIIQLLVSVYCAVGSLMNAVCHGTFAVNAAFRQDVQGFQFSGKNTMDSLQESAVYSFRAVFLFLYELTALVTRTLATIFDLLKKTTGNNNNYENNEESSQDSPLHI